MDDSPEIEEVRAEALRKLGRNIVNFSKIEAALKHLLSVSKLVGTEEIIFEYLKKNQDRSHKKTLGTLVQEFHSNVLVDASQVDAATDSSSAETSFSFKATYGNPESLKKWKRSLAEIVCERNRLIHDDLARLDTSSIEDYRKLISRLDEQNPRLLTHLEELGWMLKQMPLLMTLAALLLDSLQALSALSDEEVLALTELQMEPGQDVRLNELLERQQSHSLLEDERLELQTLMQISQEGLLRKVTALSEAVKRRLIEPLS